MLKNSVKFYSKFQFKFLRILDNTRDSFPNVTSNAIIIIIIISGLNH